MDLLFPLLRAAVLHRSGLLGFLVHCAACNQHDSDQQQGWKEYGWDGVAEGRGNNPDSDRSLSRCADSDKHLELESVVHDLVVGVWRIRGSVTLYDHLPHQLVQDNTRSVSSSMPGLPPGHKGMHHRCRWLRPPLSG